MTFINASLLAGTAAFLIPLVIHLLNRARFQVIEWGATHLFDLDVQVNSRRLQLRSLLLLIVRCFIPVLLALCLARPVLTAWKSIGGRGKSAVVLLVDNSISMQAPTENSSTALDAAKQQAEELIARLGSGTRYSILTTGGKPTNISSGAASDWRSVGSILASIRGGAGPSRILDGIFAAVKELDQLSESRRSIVVFSDFQRSEWQNISDSALAVGKLVASSNIPARIAFYPIGTKRTENLSIEIDSTTRHIVALGQSMEIIVSVVNHGDNPANKVPITLQVDAQRLAQQTVEIAANSRVQARFICQFDSMGSHLITAQLEDSSSIEGDDSSHIAVRVIDRIMTLIIDQTADLPEMQRKSAFLRLALTPLSSNTTANSGLIRAEVISPGSIDEKRLENAQVVILADVPQLRDESADRLAEFVHRGGILIIFSGDAIQADWYNTHWGVAGRNNLLPLAYTAPSTASTRSSPVSRIKQEAFSHPALVMFNNRDNGELSKISFHSWHRLSSFSSVANEAMPEAPGPAYDAANAESSLVIASLDSGDPLLAEKRFGQGLVIQAASSCDSLWSDLPQRPVFLPLVQQLVTTSVFMSEPESRIDCGQPFTYVLRQRDAVPERSTHLNTDNEQDASVTTPSGDHYPVALIQQGQQARIEFDLTQYPGCYDLRFGAADSGTAERRATYFVATASPAESLLETMSDEGLSAIASRLGADIVRSTDDFIQSENERQFGREIWRYLLLALVCFLSFELWLQQRLVRTVA